MKKFHCVDANRLCFGSLALLVLLMLVPAHPANAGRQIWQSRDQFVALEHQDSLKNGTVLLNDHPLAIPIDRLTAMLASIEFEPAGSGKPEQIFTKQSLETLAPQLAEGFRQAAPDEDVTFAIIGLHQSLLGLAKSPGVTSGRAFYQGGRLNIIFGLIRSDFNEREDRRLAPFTPGSRQIVAAGAWRLQLQPGQSGYNQVRKDWLTFSDAWQASSAQIPVTVQTTPSAQCATPLPVQRKNDPLTPAERLTTLKELQEKGLINEEEYRGKRLEILNGL